MVLHLDGDAFFVSCEIARRPYLRGKAVVVGKERGIASAMSYEAKAKGVTRGMPIYQIKHLDHSIVILDGDYDLYAACSRKMYNIVCRYSPSVEAYSIDECFADWSDFEGHTERALSLKKDLQREVGVTFSVGLAPTKVLAKICSKFIKPDGFVSVESDVDRRNLLDRTMIGKVWGIGASGARSLSALDIKTALDFADKERFWIEGRFSKPLQQIWYELNGTSVYRVETGERAEQKSITKSKTFLPASDEKSFVYSELSKNTENACIKLRRQGLFARKASFFLKTQKFRYTGAEVDLGLSLRSPSDMLKKIEPVFEAIYEKGVLYRATGINLFDFCTKSTIQSDLFGQSEKNATSSEIFRAVDEIDGRFGKHTIFLASTLLSVGKKVLHREDLFGSRSSCPPFLGDIS